MNLFLNDKHDIEVSGRSMRRHTGTEYSAQTAKCNLMTQQGEWIVDEDLGLPWLTGALEKGVPLQLIINLIYSTVINTVGILSVDSVEVNMDKSKRRLVVNFTATTIYGKTFSRSIG